MTTSAFLKKLPISLVLITKNAQRELAACLESAPFVDDIVIVDSGSTDGTQALADSFGARVLFQEWLGFGPQKAWAVSQAKNDWVLCLDADERLSEPLANSIVTAFKNSSHKVFRVARCNRFLGRYLRHGEGYPDWNTRFFHRDFAAWTQDPVHEHVITQEPLGTLNGDLLHDSAETLSSYLAKQNRYTELSAQAAIAAGKRASFARLFLSPLFRFFKFFVLKKGFLDGTPGFIHIVIGCFNSFMKYAKMIELQTKEIS